MIIACLPLCYNMKWNSSQSAEAKRKKWFLMTKRRSHKHLNDQQTQNVCIKNHVAPQDNMLPPSPPVTSNKQRSQTTLLCVWLCFKDKHKDPAVTDGKCALRHTECQISSWQDARPSVSCHAGPLPSLAFPSCLSPLGAAGQTIPDSQLLGRRRLRKRRRRKGRGECSLGKSWLGATAAPCPLSAPAVRAEYSNHKKLAVNDPSPLNKW